MYIYIYIYIYVFCTERAVDGNAFTNLNREDIAVTFSEPEKLVMASKLYKMFKKFEHHMHPRTPRVISDLPHIHHLMLEVWPEAKAHSDDDPTQILLKAMTS